MIKEDMYAYYYFDNGQYLHQTIYLKEEPEKFFSQVKNIIKTYPEETNEKLLLFFARDFTGTHSYYWDVVSNLIIAASQESIFKNHLLFTPFGDFIENYIQTDRDFVLFGKEWEKELEYTFLLERGIRYLKTVLEWLHNNPNNLIECIVENNPLLFNQKEKMDDWLNNLLPNEPDKPITDIKIKKLPDYLMYLYIGMYYLYIVYKMNFPIGQYWRSYEKLWTAKCPVNTLILWNSNVLSFKDIYCCFLRWFENIHTILGIDYYQRRNKYLKEDYFIAYFHEINKRKINLSQLLAVLVNQYSIKHKSVLPIVKPSWDNVFYISFDLRFWSNQINEPLFNPYKYMDFSELLIHLHKESEALYDVEYAFRQSDSRIEDNPDEFNTLQNYIGINLPFSCNIEDLVYYTKKCKDLILSLIDDDNYRAISKYVSERKKKII